MKHTGKSIALGLLATPVALMTGCTNTYKMETLPLETPAVKAGTTLPTLKAGDQVVVSKPADGQYGQKPYKGSGAMVQLAVVGCLKANRLDAMAKDEAAGATKSPSKWQVVPTILEWEDRATEWSGLPDRIKVELRTIDPTGCARDATIISGSSKWATFGGDHPQDMLAPAMVPWAAHLLKTAPAKPK
jgi:hypothetical protein